MRPEMFEPVKGFNELEIKIRNEAEKEINNLIKETGIDEEKNIESVQEYDEISSQFSYATQKANNSYNKRVIAIIFIIIGIVATIVSVLGFLGIVSVPVVVSISMLVVGLILAISLITVIVVKINKEIRERNSIVRDLDQAKEEQYKQCCIEVFPLNDVLNDEMTSKLINKVIPEIVIDKNFTAKRSAFLREYYEFNEDTADDECVLSIVSGSINDNPFFTERVYYQEMGTKRYEGSLTINWTEYKYDSEGNGYEVEKSQTLVASVIKPYPKYYKLTRTAFFSGAAKDLSYSRTSSNANFISEKGLEKMISKGEKKLEKLSKKALANGDTFTMSTNSEFDVMYGAHDRDNEIQFRMLFTPIAQKNIVALLKDKKNFGDDFDFVKNNCINVILSDHAQEWNYNMSADNYYSHDVREIRQNYIEYNTDFFKNLFFELAPILSVPLYMQTKPIEYEKNYEYDENNISIRQAMVMANALGDDVFSAPESATSAILKCRYIDKVGKIDKYAVDAYTFMIRERVDYVSVRCDNGKYYNVPVPWDEYIPIQNTTAMYVTALNLNSREYESINDDETFVNMTKSFVEGDNCVYKDGVFAYIGNCSEEIDAMLSKYSK